MLIIPLIVSSTLAVVFFLLYLRESRKVAKLSKIPGENVKALQDLLFDLQTVSGGMLRIERINPDHVYLHSPL